MGDLSTREQIRAEAIERLAVGQFEIDERDFRSAALPARAWAEVPEGVRQRYRGDAEPLVDALGNLLPTGERWGVEPLGREGHRHVVKAPDEAAARLLFNRFPDHTIVHRFEHDWTEVPE